MKKIMLLLLVLICVLSAFVFSSCGSDSDGEKPSNTTAEAQKEDKPEEPKEPESAVELWKMVDEKMNSLDSYESEYKGELVYYTYGSELKCAMTGRGVVLGESTDKPFFYEYTHMEAVCEELDYQAKYSSLYAYDDGKMYLFNEDENVNQKIFSNMSKEDFIKYREEKFEDNLDYLDCKNAEFTKNEDGTWGLEFSGYTKKAIDVFVKEAEIDPDIYGFEVSDLKITVTANKDYCVTSMKIELVLQTAEGDTSEPRYVMSMDYSKFNSAEKATFDTQGYKEVEDVRILKTIEEKLDALYAEENGKFTLDVKQIIKLDGQQISEDTEKDVISYGKESGVYFYNMEIETPELDMTIKYKNGVQYIIVGEETQSANITDDVAKNTINGLINTMKFDSDSVSNIQKTAEGVYKFDIDYADESFYSPLFTEAGITDGYGKQTITVTFENDKISKIEGEIHAKCKIDNGGVMSDVDLIITASNIFEYVTGPSENV